MQVGHVALAGTIASFAPQITTANVPSIQQSPAAAALITFSAGILHIPD